jgi:hypothetical protein
MHCNISPVLVAAFGSFINGCEERRAKNYGTGGCSSTFLVVVAQFRLRFFIASASRNTKKCFDLMGILKSHHNLKIRLSRRHLIRFQLIIHGSSSQIRLIWDSFDQHGWWLWREREWLIYKIDKVVLPLRTAHLSNRVMPNMEINYFSLIFTRPNHAAKSDQKNFIPTTFDLHELFFSILDTWGYNSIIIIIIAYDFVSFETERKVSLAFCCLLLSVSISGNTRNRLFAVVVIGSPR